VNYIVKKRSHPFRVGDLITCWDEEMNRSIIGYVLEVRTNKRLGDDDIHIRWNDIFVAFEVCGSTDATRRMRAGLWRIHRMNTKL